MAEAALAQQATKAALPAPVSAAGGDSLSSLVAQATAQQRKTSSFVDQSRAKLGEIGAEQEKISGDFATRLDELNKEHAQIASQFPQQEFKPPTPRNPLEGWGSVAGALAMIASAFTKTPLTTALNAASAGMRAVQAGNFDEYNIAHETWKTNTDYAIKRANWELQQYELDLNATKMSYEGKTAAIRAKAAAMNDQATLLTLEAKGIDGVFEKIISQRTLTANLEKNTAEVDIALKNLGLNQQRTATDTAKGAAEIQKLEADSASDIELQKIYQQGLEELRAQNGGQEPTADQKLKLLKSAQTGSGSNVLSITPLGNGTMMRNYRNGTSEVVNIDGTPVLGASNSATLAGEKRLSEKRAETRATREALLPKARTALDQLAIQRQVITRALDTLIGSEGSKGQGQITGLTSGFLGSTLARVLGSPQYNVARTLDTLKANVGFDKLQAMREASPTGGALGQVSDYENRTLQSVLGSIEQPQSQSQLRSNLTSLRGTLKAMDGARQEAFNRDFGDITGSTQGSATPGAGSGIAVGTTAVGPNGARLRWSGSAWEPMQ